MTLRRPITFACASSSKPGWTLTKNSKNCCKRDCLTRAIFQKWPRLEMLANKRFLDWSGKGDAVMPLGKKKNEKNEGSSLDPSARVARYQWRRMNGPWPVSFDQRSDGSWNDLKRVMEKMVTASILLLLLLLFVSTALDNSLSNLFQFFFLVYYAYYKRWYCCYENRCLDATGNRGGGRKSIFVSWYLHKMSRYEKR